MLHSIRMGWMKLRKQKKDEDDRPKFYDIWSNESQVELTKRHHSHIAAPKEKLPGHEESYRPPPEYLPTEEEVSGSIFENISDAPVLRVLFSDVAKWG